MFPLIICRIALLTSLRPSVCESQRVAIGTPPCRSLHLFPSVLPCCLIVPLLQYTSLRGSYGLYMASLPHHSHDRILNTQCHHYGHRVHTRRGCGR